MQSFSNFFNFIPTELSAAVVIFNIIFSFALGLGIAWIYRKTHRGLSYSSSFVSTLVVMNVLAATVMMIVQNNLVGAFGLLGAFSLIRFRTIMKETRDISFVFFSLVIGIAVGTGNYIIALFSTLFVSAIILFLSYKKFGASFSDDFLLTLLVEGHVDGLGLEEILKEYLQKYKLVHIRSGGEGMNEYLYAVDFKKGKKPDYFVGELNKRRGVKKIDMVTAAHSVEY